MANPKHLAKLKEGTQAWNLWRTEHPGDPDLSNADLHETNLRGANCLQVNLCDANLYEAQLEDANLNGADLAGANLSKAKLNYADLRGAALISADLTEAVLDKADLSSAALIAANLSHSSLFLTNCYRADFREASLVGAGLLGTSLHGAILDKSNLTAATIGDAVFAENDLSTVIGLETVHHSRPSTIGIDTIYLSKGKIPEKFLRGAGVSDDFIAYAKSLVANPIEFYSCFISYSTKDQDFADRLYADLQNKGVRCWFAPHDIQGGKKLHEQIDEAIRLHDKLLLILSPHSMESEWVKTEIAKARKREVSEKRRVLFPIRLVSFETLRDWSVSTPTPEKIPPARFASTSSPTSATGRTTTHIRKLSSG